MAILQNLLVVAIVAVSMAKASIAYSPNSPILENRDAYYGGFALDIPSDGQCPSGTKSYASGLNGGPCCPSNDVYPDTGNFCCPNSTDCSHQVLAKPTCADPSWVMWSDNSTGIVDPENNLCCPVGWYVDGQTECAPPGGTGVSASSTVFITATESNNVQPTGTAAGSGSSGAATVMATGSAGAGTTAGTSASQSSTQSAPSPTATKSAGYKAIVASGSLVWIVVLSMFFT